MTAGDDGLSYALNRGTTFYAAGFHTQQIRWDSVNRQATLKIVA